MMGIFFLQKLHSLDPKAKDILKAGAFSFRRTKKNYGRSAVDLCLEQTVNRDAASPMRGITSFRNSESAFRRWAVTLTQQGMAISELRELVGIHSGEHPVKQSQLLRVKQDNRDINTLIETMKNTCNPFSITSSCHLYNLSSREASQDATMEFLLGTLNRGKQLKQLFECECSDETRFLKRLPRIKMLNFAAEIVKTPKTIKDANTVEGVRDVLGGFSLFQLEQIRM